MKVHGKQFIIDLSNGNDGVLAMESIIVTVCDEGAGPFLEIRCQNLGATDQDQVASACLGSLEEIDQLCTALKKILGDALLVENSDS